jgi:hypothetical protein
LHILTSIGLLAAAAAPAGGDWRATPSTSPWPRAELEAEAPALPPLPPGVEELRFSDFFKPIGAFGLEYTDRLRELEGRRVRILGYMVNTGTPRWGGFMLAPLPLTHHDREYGQADDLPPATLHVVMPGRAGFPPFTPGLMLLTGRLELGPREEVDGRVSHVRLLLDPPTPEVRRQMLAAQSATSQPSARGEPTHSDAARSGPR